MLRQIFAISAFCALAPCPVLADGRATIESSTPQGAQRIEVAWNEAGGVRFDPGNADAYMLVHEGVLYAVTSAGGMGPMVMNLSALEGMGGAAGTSPDQGASAAVSVERAEKVISITATGRKETVAGMPGERYDVTWADTQGAQHTDDAVLSNAPLARELARAFETLAATTQKGEVDPRQQAVRDRGLAILRYADSYAVVAASADGLSPGAFALPAKPTDLQDMMKNMGQGR